MNETFLRFPGFRFRALTLNYDDGTVFDRQLIEIMTKHGIRGTFNLNSGLFGTGRRMTKEDALALYEPNGMEVYCHGLKHIHPVDVPPLQATEEFLEDRKNMEAIFGHIVNGIAYAYGQFDETVDQIVKNMGFKVARITGQTEAFGITKDWLHLQVTCRHRNPKLFELADKFLKDPAKDAKSPLRPRWFQLFGHSYEFNDDDNWDIIREFCEKVGDREDIWYCTTGEMYRYAEAFRALEYSADLKRIENHSDRDLYLCIDNENILV